MLRRWLSHPSRPEEVRHCKHLLEKAFGSAAEDYVPSQEDYDFKKKTTVPIPNDLIQLCGCDSLVEHARWKRNGIIYSRATTHVGNSQIFFFPTGDRTAQPVPGCIKYIFTKDKAVYFAVQQYDACPSNIIDPFLRYPRFLARLYSTSLKSTLERVKLDLVVGHYARWEMSEDLALIVQLSNVCKIFIVLAQTYIICRYDGYAISCGS